MIPLSPTEIFGIIAIAIIIGVAICEWCPICKVCNKTKGQ